MEAVPIRSAIFAPSSRNCLQVFVSSLLPSNSSSEYFLNAFFASFVAFVLSNTRVDNSRKRGEGRCGLAGGGGRGASWTRDASAGAECFAGPNLPESGNRRDSASEERRPASSNGETL